MIRLGIRLGISYSQFRVVASHTESDPCDYVRLG